VVEREGRYAAGVERPFPVRNVTTIRSNSMGFANGENASPV